MVIDRGAWLSGRYGQVYDEIGEEGSAEHHAVNCDESDYDTESLRNVSMNLKHLVE